MSSDNFDLQAADGRVWQNLSDSSYEDLSSEAIVVLMEVEGRKTSKTYSDYTEYGIRVAGEVKPRHYTEALFYSLHQHEYRIRALEDKDNL